jgi:hypothetical protein
MTGLEALAAHRIALAVGQEDVEPEGVTMEAILAAVARHDAGARIPGLPDELNPFVLDPARVRAFVEGLGAVPAAVLDRLDDRAIVLASEGLGLSTSSVVDAEAIARGYTLDLPADLGSMVQPGLRAPIDVNLGRTRAARARDAVARFDAEVAQLEREKRDAEAFEAKHRRFAAAKVWAAASRALSAMDPADGALAEEARAAIEAVRRFVVRPRTGMP